MHEEKIITVANLTRILNEHTHIVLLSDETNCVTSTPLCFVRVTSLIFLFWGTLSPIFRICTDLKPIPKLYQNIFSLDYPDSFAYVCGAGFQMAIFPIYDLISMALAQVWKGAGYLITLKGRAIPSQEHYQWILTGSQEGNVHPDLSSSL